MPRNFNGLEIPDIHRPPSPEVELMCNGEEMRLTYDNTTLYHFEQYPVMDHIYVRNDGEDDANEYYLFVVDQVSKEVFEALKEANFPYFVAQYPRDCDIYAFMVCQDQALEDDLAQLSRPPKE